MLGSEVAKVLANDNLFSITATHRDSPWGAWSIFKSRPNNINFINYDCTPGSLKNLHKKIGSKFDYIINCIGAISVNRGSLSSTYVNGVFPHELSKWGKGYGCKLIHISSDGVFSGQRTSGKYTEMDPCDDISLYGKSKSIGEPKRSMVLRTSVIAEDKFANNGLISWAKLNKNKKVDGYTNHLWNGMTGAEYGKACRKIILNNLYEEGVFHIFSPQIISKFDLIKFINNNFNLNINITPIESTTGVNRSLDTVKNLNRALEIPAIHDQIRELH